MHVSPAPSPLGKTDVDPRASVTQANWIWPAAGALTAHSGGGREGKRWENLPSPAAGVEELGRGCCFARRSVSSWWQRHKNAGPVPGSSPGVLCPFAAFVRSVHAMCGSVCVCVLLCFSTLCFLVIIPSKVTEISFVREANRALPYYGIT